MKKLISVLLTLCLALSLAACGGEPAGTTAPATKTVYLADTVTYDYSDDSIDFTVKYTYDELGRPIQTTQTDANGEIVMTYAYGENGKVQSATQTVGDTVMTISITYDENDNMLTQTLYNGETAVQTMEFAYDEQGRQTSVVTKSDDYSSTTTYTYGESDQPISVTEVQDGAVIAKMDYTYDEEGNCTAILTTNADGSVASKTQIVYEGSTETRTITDAEGNVLQTTVRTRDENGNLIKEEYTTSFFGYTCTTTYITMEVPAEAE